MPCLKCPQDTISSDEPKLYKARGLLSHLSVKHATLYNCVICHQTEPVKAYKAHQISHIKSFNEAYFPGLTYFYNLKILNLSLLNLKLL